MINALKHFGYTSANTLLLAPMVVPKALAVDGVLDSGDVSLDAQDSDSLRNVLISITTQVLSFMALIAVIVIIIAGIRLVIGGADESQREKARNTVLYAVVGLILILLAQAIVAFVGTFFE